MPRYFTHYWRNETCEREKELWETNPEGYPLNHAADNRYAERGVAAGDYIYPVTVVEGELYVPVHLQDRFRVVSYSNGYETSDLRTCAFKDRAQRA